MLVRFFIYTISNHICYMQIVLFDNKNYKNLFPLTEIRAVADLPLGIFTIKQWWENRTESKVFIHTRDLLKKLYDKIPENTPLIWVDANVLADENLFQKIIQLNIGESIADNKGLVAAHVNISTTENIIDTINSQLSKTIQIADTFRLEFPHQLLNNTDNFITRDFKLITKGRKSQPISQTNNIVNPDNIFIEEGAVIEFATLNASTGPIYIGKNCVVMEGSCIRGPFAMMDNSVVKMGAKIYGATRIGKKCTVGGEIKNSVLFDYSNKAHDGYLGDSVLASWCNLGAGTSNSNIKNNCSDVMMFNAGLNEQINAGMKAGCIIADYCTTAINSSINTGTVIETGSNVFGSGLLPKHIKKFSWGTNGETVEIGKALDNIRKWKNLKNEVLSDIETEILNSIFEQNF